MSLSPKLILCGAAGGLIAATPAFAQSYRYGAPYGNAYGYNNPTTLAAQRCTAAVQQRLNTRGTSGGILGAIFGVNRYNYSNARVLSVTQVDPRRNGVRVRGIASSGRLASNPYGVAAYGMLGANYAPAADLRFSCNVDYRGYVRNVDINRR
jgi:hypothetical protein